MPKWTKKSERSRLLKGAVIDVENTECPSFLHPNPQNGKTCGRPVDPDRCFCTECHDRKITASSIFCPEREPTIFDGSPKD